LVQVESEILIQFRAGSITQIAHRIKQMTLNYYGLLLT
jgi:hypothetical protein